jgi:hypothetical protein
MHTTSTIAIDLFSEMNPGKVGKSGTTYTIQHGFDWYPDYDMLKYIIARVLILAVPKNTVGHVRPDHALVTLKELMQRPDFGPCPEIRVMVVTGKGASREHITFLLTKEQALKFAANLSNEYIHMIATHFHSSLSETERNMNGVDFIKMMTDRAESMCLAEVKAETVENRETRVSSLETLEKLIQDIAAIEPPVNNDALGLSEVGDAMRHVSTSDANPASLSVDQTAWLKDYIAQATEAYKAINTFFETCSRWTLEESGKAIAVIRANIKTINLAIMHMKGQTEKLTSPEEMVDWSPLTNEFLEVRDHTFRIGDSAHKRMMYMFNQRKMGFCADKGNPNRVADNVLAIGLYMSVYDIMAVGGVEVDNAIAPYMKERKYTSRQIDAMRAVVTYGISLPKFSRGTVLIHKDPDYGDIWVISNIVWSGSNGFWS